jgi:hypothetical protein
MVILINIVINETSCLPPTTGASVGPNKHAYFTIQRQPIFYDRDHLPRKTRSLRVPFLLVCIYPQ